MFVSELPAVVGPQRHSSEEVYFEGNKRTELNDLKQALSAVISDPDKASYRIEIIKKVISYTTSGFDTSRFYPEMVIASATKDIIEKKLIYLYLSIYSTLNNDFARMAINTFIKDSSSPDPYIRTLSIRHLSNLRFKGREMYVIPLLKQGLTDHCPSVKKTCVVGLMKLWNEIHSSQQDTLNCFYQLIRESDPSLVCTALSAIDEIETQGIAMSKKLTMYLTQHINIFNEMQLPIVLTFISLYQFKNQQEINTVYNSLVPKLKSASAAVNISVSKIFLKFMTNKPSLIQVLLPTVFKSLLAFINHSVPQIAYVVLCHLSLLIEYQRRNGVDYYSPHFKKFFLASDEQQTYLKIEKIHILQQCITKSNLTDIINQFAQYLLIDSLSAQVIQSLSKSILQVAESESKFILKTVIKTIEETASESIANAALPLILNYLRNYPQQFPLFTSIFYHLVRSAKSNHSRCCLIQIIGDYGQYIEDAVQLIAWSDNITADVPLSITLLRANLKLFLKRPSEMLYPLTHMFQHIFQEESVRLEVKDYAAMLYQAFKEQHFAKTYLENRRKKAKPMEYSLVAYEYNTLEVIYRKHQDKWILQPGKYVEAQQEVVYEEEDTQENTKVDISTVDINVDSKFKPLQYTNFDEQFILSENQFEKAYEEYQIGSSITRLVKNIDQINEENIEQLFKTWFISVIATSQDQNQIKLYAYCKVIQDGKQIGIACMELCVLKDGATLTLLIKCYDEELSIFISKYIEEFLRLNQII